MRMNWIGTIFTLTLCLAIPRPGLASQTDQLQAIRVFVDSRLDKPAINGVMDAVLHAAVQHHLDVRVRAFGTVAAEDWVPPKPLDLGDFRPSMASLVFQGEKDRESETERNKRLQAALSSLEAYFRGLSAKPHSCNSLVNVAREIASESFQVTLLVLGDTICSSPRVTMRLPNDRTLVAVLPPTADRDQGGKLDCEVVKQERRIRSSFPGALVIPTVGTDTLAEALLKRTYRPVSAGLEVQGCSSFPVSRPGKTARMDRKPEAVLQDETTSIRDSGLRIITPKHHAHVARLVPFQGDGAHPGETLVPIIRVGDEYWPQVFVHAREDGSYGGEVIVGRYFNDCGVTVELRLFGSVQQPISLGRPVGSWPVASEASLPVELTRTEECIADGDRVK